MVVNNEATLSLCYNLLVKPSDDQLKLTKVRYEIHPENTKNILIFEQNIVNESKKTVQLKYTKSNIIDFNFSKKILMSSNQVYKLDFTVLKKYLIIKFRDPNIKISVLTIKINFPEEERKSINESKSINPKKVFEFYSLDNEGNITEKNDYFSTKIEEIDSDEKINRFIIFK